MAHGNSKSNPMIGNGPKNTADRRQSISQRVQIVAPIPKYLAKIKTN